MLIFDFKCEDCGDTHEQYVGKSDMIPGCPNCGSPYQKKLLTGVGDAYVKTKYSQEDLANYTYGGKGQSGDLRSKKKW